MSVDLTAISSADLCAELERRYQAENPDPPRAYYYGVAAGRRSGHFLTYPGGHSAYKVEDQLRQIFKRDGGWYPQDTRTERYGAPQTEGLAVFEHHGGWTYLGFWDRSADPRGNCCSAFLLEGTLYFDQAVQVARERFPRIWARYTFEVRRGSR